MKKKKKKSVLLAVILSFVPGLAQIYLGNIKKGLFLLIITAGIFLTVILSKSYLMKLIMSGIYFVAFAPALAESYQIARYGRSRIDTEARWYINIMLFTTGFSALPLLWGSKNFSKVAKIAWTVAVPTFATIYVLFLVRFWDRLEQLLRKFLGA